MSNINSVVLSGCLGADPEMKYFETGSCKATLKLAVNKWNKKESKEVANWFSVEVWGKQAEFVGEYARKGSKVVVLGMLDTSSWQDDSGNTKTKTFIFANNVEVISKKTITEEEQIQKEHEKLDKDIKEKTLEEQLDYEELGEDEIPF